MFAQQNDVTSRIALALNLERAVRFADAIPEYEIILAAIPNAVGVIPTRPSAPCAANAQQRSVQDDRFIQSELQLKHAGLARPFRTILYYRLTCGRRAGGVSDAPAASAMVDLEDQ
jgi:hypothetical protein